MLTTLHRLSALLLRRKQERDRRRELASNRPAHPGHPVSMDSPEPPSPQRNVDTSGVDHSLVQTFKRAWQKEDLHLKSQSEQAEAMALMVLVVNTDVEDPADRKATLDYIQRNIDSW